MNKVNILFSSFPNFSGNPKAFFEFLNNNYRENFNLYWVIYNDDELAKKLMSLNINCVLYDSEQYKQLISKINLILDTHGTLLNEKNENNIYINMWHGLSGKKGGYFMDEKNFAPQDEEWLNLLKNKTDFMCAPSEFAKVIFSSEFGINVQRVLPFGFCRNEFILKSNGKSLLQKLTDKNINSYSKIIFYLPTFRNGLNRNDSESIFSNNLLNLEKYEENTLLEYLKNNNYLLVIKKHPSEEDKIKNINNSNILILNDKRMTENLISIQEILNAADLLISDYSSIYIEYLLLDRPVLFFHRDINDYALNRGIIFNNYEFWFPGPKATTLSDFISFTNKLFEDPKYFSIERQNFKKLVLSDDTNICKNFFEFLFDKNNYSLKYNPYISKEDSISHELLKSEEKNKELFMQNTNLKNEINNIYNSKSWKIMQIFQKIKSKFKRK